MNHDGLWLYKSISDGVTWMAMCFMEASRSSNLYPSDVEIGFRRTQMVALLPPWGAQPPFYRNLQPMQMRLSALPTVQTAICRRAHTFEYLIVDMACAVIKDLSFQRLFLSTLIRLCTLK